MQWWQVWINVETYEIHVSSMYIVTHIADQLGQVSRHVWQCLKHAPGFNDIDVIEYTVDIHTWCTLVNKQTINCSS